MAVERLSSALWQQLEGKFKRGPLVQGFDDEDQGWTRKRIPVGYTVLGVWGRIKTRRPRRLECLRHRPHDAVTATLTSPGASRVGLRRRAASPAGCRPTHTAAATATTSRISPHPRPNPPGDPGP